MLVKSKTKQERINRQENPPNLPQLTDCIAVFSLLARNQAAMEAKHNRFFHKELQAFRSTLRLLFPYYPLLLVLVFLLLLNAACRLTIGRCFALPVQRWRRGCDGGSGNRSNQVREARFLLAGGENCLFQLGHP